MTTKVVLLRQTIIERAFYEVAKIENRDEEMRQICCHPQLSQRYVWALNGTHSTCSLDESQTAN